MRPDDIPVFRPGRVSGDGVVQDYQSLSVLKPCHKIRLRLLSDLLAIVVSHDHIILARSLGLEHRECVRMFYGLVSDVRVILVTLEERFLLECMAARYQQHADLALRLLRRLGRRRNKKTEKNTSE